MSGSLSRVKFGRNDSTRACTFISEELIFQMNVNRGRAPSLIRNGMRETARLGGRSYCTRVNYANE